MRLTAPRINPLAEADIAPDLLALLGPRFKAMPVLNIFRTLAHAPKAFKRFMAWGGYILSDANSLSPRDRELVILRTGFNWNLATSGRSMFALASTVVSRSQKLSASRQVLRRLSGKRQTGRCCRRRMNSQATHLFLMRPGLRWITTQKNSAWTW